MAGVKRKKYDDDDLRLCNFKIRHQSWERFQKLCHEQGISASQSIAAYVESVIESQTIIKPEAATDKALSDFKIELLSVIDGLKQRIEVLENKPAKTAIATSPKPKAKAKKRNTKSSDEVLAEINAKGWLIAEQFHKHIGMSSAHISRKSNELSKEEFADYTRQNDPDGIAWEKLPEKFGKFAVYKPINTDDTNENAL